MFKSFFAIVVTLLSISFSNVAYGEECTHTASEDEQWLKSQPLEPISAKEDQMFVSRNVLGYLQSKTCKGIEVSQLKADVQDSKFLIIDGSICTEKGQDRVSVLLSDGQVNTFYCM